MKTPVCSALGAGLILISIVAPAMAQGDPHGRGGGGPQERRDGPGFRGGPPHGPRRGSKGELGHLWMEIGRLGESKTPLTKKQAASILGLVRPWTKKPALTEADAKTLVQGIKAYNWGLDREPFRQWAESIGVTASQLTTPKLQRLMKRLRDEAWRPIRVKPGGAGPEIVGNQLDYPEAERADVLLGLAAFAKDDIRATRLATLYAALPKDLKVLGPRLGNGTPASVRTALVGFH